MMTLSLILKSLNDSRARRNGTLIVCPMSLIGWITYFVSVRAI
jgi:hypothetical protein